MVRRGRRDHVIKPQAPARISPPTMKLLSLSYWLSTTRHPVISLIDIPTSSLAALPKSWTVHDTLFAQSILGLIAYPKLGRVAEAEI